MRPEGASLYTAWTPHGVMGVETLRVFSHPIYVRVILLSICHLKEELDESEASFPLCDALSRHIDYRGITQNSGGLLLGG